ncbi:Nuclear pore complex protein NUP88 [Phytophthora citrophthora]|uniref:Nuclear pore complex protein NUP88 n=1 Tax=Phytophthora citrophthora TaxID=4793 RepID=A0AAD9LFI2_9STRA|nr:Nuclear pore complex protein NUP88 [Phytophthora citrophthora]
MTSRAAASSSGDDWALRTNLQLCGSVSPPTYADLRTSAHLQTFDVRDGASALWGDEGKLFLVNVFHQSQAKQTDTPKEQLLRHVTLDPPLQPHEAAEVEQIKLNASGSQVLVVAKSWLKVLRLPVDIKHKSQSLQCREKEEKLQRFLIKFEDGSEQEVTFKEEDLNDQDIAEQVKRRAAPGKRVAFVSREQCVSSVRAVGYFTTVRHAAWHPLSDMHVVVLSDSEEIEVFNTQRDVSKPEQRHRLDFPSKARTTGAISTCFSFGASIQLQHQHAGQMQAAQVWDAFTCYILRSDGAVYAMCPLVPYDCCVSKTFLEVLGTEVDAQIAVRKQKMELAGSGLQSRLLELKSQKYWLQEGWAPASTQMRRSSPRFGGRTQTPVADVFCYLSPHVSGISPDTWPLALQGPVDVTPQSVVEGKNQVSGGSSAMSLLAVPHASRNSTEKRSISASPFLMRTFTSGHVELILLDAPIRPQWRSNRQTTTANSMRKLPALLLECLNLGIDDSGGKAVLERDTADPRLVYCLHSTGVHVINVSWVFAIASGKQFTTLPKSSVRHVFSVSPGSAGSAQPSSSPGTAVSNVVGARVVKNVNFGHLLLLRLASGSFEVVNVSAASSELLKGVLTDNSNASIDAQNLQKTLPGTLASMASSKSRSALAASGTNLSDGGIRPFGDIVEEKLEALSARGTRVTGSTLMPEVDDAVLAFVLERVKILYEDVEYIDEMDQLMRDRLQLQTTMVKTQTEKVVAVQKSADDARASMKKLLEKMERALAVQKNLSKRAAAVLQAVKENQPNLSRAEREFKSELDLMAVEVRRMKPRVAELTVQGQRTVRSLESTALSASSSRRYWNSLATSGGPSGLSNEKKKMCYDVLRAETQLIDDTKVLLEDLSANLQQLKE